MREQSAPIRFNIPEPCHENWDQMRPEQQSRYCASCEKTVTDFASMTDQAILKFVHTNGLGCGRFRDDQLQRSMVLPPKAKPNYSTKLMLTIGLLVSAIKEGRAQAIKSTGITMEQLNAPTPKWICESRQVTSLTDIAFCNTISRQPITYQRGYVVMREPQIYYGEFMRRERIRPSPLSFRLQRILPTIAIRSIRLKRFFGFGIKKPIEPLDAAPPVSLRSKV